MTTYNAKGEMTSTHYFPMPERHDACRACYCNRRDGTIHPTYDIWIGSRWEKDNIGRWGICDTCGHYQVYRLGGHADITSSPRTHVFFRPLL